MRRWDPSATAAATAGRRARMVGRVYEVPGRMAENRTSGAAGPWQVFEGGLVRVVVQGAGWPTNVLVERLDSGERFVRPARGMRKIRT